MSVLSIVRKPQPSVEPSDISDVTDVRDKLMPVGFVEEYSDARVSPKEKQPKNIGHPYTIHVPTEYVRNIPATTVRGFISVGVEFKESRPLFYRCDSSFTKIRVKNGDITTANRIIETLKEQTSRIFTNWK